MKEQHIGEEQETAACFYASLKGGIGTFGPNLGTKDLSECSGASFLTCINGKPDGQC